MKAMLPETIICSDYISKLFSCNALLMRVEGKSNNLIMGRLKIVKDFLRQNNVVYKDE